jgi:carboxymethylenebutenolidase
MGEWIELTAADGHKPQAYCALPEGRPRAALVVLQEIFGVTVHVRAVADGYAQNGYAVVAPALFDRAARGTELEYSDIAGGRALVERTAPADAAKDIAAAVAWGKEFGKVGVVGFCWGGTLAYLAAAQQPIDAAVAYYGGMIAKFLERKPKVPVLYHFGGKDPYIPLADVVAVRAAVGGSDLHVYDEAGHGFNCDERADFAPQAAAVARERTLAFLRAHLG